MPGSCLHLSAQKQRRCNEMTHAVCRVIPVLSNKDRRAGWREGWPGNNQALTICVARVAECVFASPLVRADSKPGSNPCTNAGSGEKPQITFPTRPSAAAPSFLSDLTRRCIRFCICAAVWLIEGVVVSAHRLSRRRGAGVPARISRVCARYRCVSTGPL